MKILPTCALALCIAAPAFAGEAPPAPQSTPQSPPVSGPQQSPARDWDTLLQELRRLDSSQDKHGDHVVGEMLC